MPRGKRKEAGAGAAEAKKAKTGLHAGDALPVLKELRDEADKPVQLNVRTSRALSILLVPPRTANIQMWDESINMLARQRLWLAVRRSETDASLPAAGNREKHRRCHLLFPEGQHPGAPLLARRTSPHALHHCVAKSEDYQQRSAALA